MLDKKLWKYKIARSKTGSKNIQNNQKKKKTGMWYYVKDELRLKNPRFIMIFNMK